MSGCVRFRSTVVYSVLALVGITSSAFAQRSDVGAKARAAARAYREHNEAAIVSEFAALLAVPHLASDSTNICRNADLLLGMLQKRGFRNTRLLTVPNAPPAVYG